MKILILLIATTTFGVLSAQPSPPPLEGDSPLRDKILKKLDPEMRQRMEAALEVALNDSAVRSAREKAKTALDEARDQTRAAMIKSDPGLKAEIEKAFPKAKLGEPRRKAPGFGSLDPAEKAKLLRARGSGKDSPKVRAAREKLNKASTPGERQAASQEYREAMSAVVQEKAPDVSAALQTTPGAMDGER